MLSEYREKGFVVKKGLIAPEDLDLIRCEAKKIFLIQMTQEMNPGIKDLSEQEFEQRLFDYFKKDLAGFINCSRQIQHLISLQRLGVHKRILEALKGLGLESAIHAYDPVCYFNSRHLATREHYWRQSAHQDWRAMQGSLDSVVVWIPLVNVDRSLGALEVIPGSHKGGVLDADYVENYWQIKSKLLDEAQFLPMELNKGDALFFSTLLVHRSGANSTNSIRWSSQLRFNNLQEKTFLKRKFPMLYAPQHLQPDLFEPGFPTKQMLERFFENKSSERSR